MPIFPLTHDWTSTHNWDSIYGGSEMKLAYKVILRVNFTLFEIGEYEIKDICTAEQLILAFVGGIHTIALGSLKKKNKTTGLKQCLNL